MGSVFHESDPPLPSAATSDRGKKQTERIPAHSLAWRLIGWKHLSTHHKLVGLWLATMKMTTLTSHPMSLGLGFKQKYSNQRMRTYGWLDQFLPNAREIRETSQTKAGGGVAMRGMDNAPRKGRALDAPLPQGRRNRRRVSKGKGQRSVPGTPWGGSLGSALDYVRAGSNHKEIFSKSTPHMWYFGAFLSLGLMGDHLGKDCTPNLLLQSWLLGKGWLEAWGLSCQIQVHLYLIASAAVSGNRTACCLTLPPP